jgi:hypothetical protein
MRHEARQVPSWLIFDVRQMDRFRKDLPRFASLYDEFVTQDERNFFLRFPERLAPTFTPTLAYYRRFEEWMTYIPDNQWSTFRRKVEENVLRYEDRRFWQQLHDVFSEALGFKLLCTKYGCDSVSFFRPSERKTPDLIGRSQSAVHYLEAKTINHTQEERLSWYDLAELQHAVVLPPKVERKIGEAYAEAVSQLKAPDDAGTSVKVALLVFHVDHNIDPMDEAIESVVLRYLASIEKPDVTIECHIFTS